MSSEIRSRIEGRESKEVEEREKAGGVNKEMR